MGGGKLLAVSDGFEAAFESWGDLENTRITCHPLHAKSYARGKSQDAVTAITGRCE
jgi:hypothetical protein